MSEIVKLSKLEEYLVQKEKEEFLIVKARINKENEKLIEIAIEENPQIASNIAERRIISNPSLRMGGTETIRFSAGGVGIVIKTPNQKYLITTLRISKSSFDRHLTSFTGLGCASEITNPLRTAIRKGIEDLVIVSKNGIVVPIFEGDLPFEINTESIVKNGASFYSETKDLPFIKKKVDILTSPNEKEFRIIWKGKEYSYSGIPVYDKGTRGLDFIKLISINLEEKIENLKFLDGRIMGGKNPLRREIYALKLDDKLLWTGKINFGWHWNVKNKKYEFFVPDEKTRFPQTPVLKTIIAELSKIAQ